MSASRRAPKPRYVLTTDRDRIAVVAGALCGVVVFAISTFSGHQLLETIFRAMIAMLITYVTAYVVVWMVAYLRDTQSVVEETVIETEVEEPETE